MNILIISCTHEMLIKYKISVHINFVSVEIKRKEKKIIVICFPEVQLLIKATQLQLQHNYYKQMFVYLFLVRLDLYLGPQLLLSQLSYNSSSFCSGYFGDRVLMNYFPGLTSNLDPPDFSLLSTYSYRCEPHDTQSQLNFKIQTFTNL
jgi:hypothetical protein